MFGSLKPHLCELSPNDHDIWRQAYCGNCKALGDQYGQLSRMTLSYDQVFFSLFIDALQETSAARDKGRCPIEPWRFRPIFSPESIPMQLASAYQAILIDQWVKDQYLDRSKLWGIAQRFSKKLSEKAGRQLVYMHELLTELMNISQKQKDLELKYGEKLTSDEACEPTANLISLILIHSFAYLYPDHNPQKDAQKTILKLRRFGMALGSAIYLSDALEDIEKDKASKQFNVCLRKVGDRIVRNEYHIKRCHQSLLKHAQDLKTLLPQLPLLRHQDLLLHLVGRFAFKADLLGLRLYSPQTNTFKDKLLGLRSKVSYFIRYIKNWPQRRKRYQEIKQRDQALFDQQQQLSHECEVQASIDFLQLKEKSTQKDVTHHRTKKAHSPSSHTAPHLMPHTPNVTVASVAFSLIQSNDQNTKSTYKSTYKSSNNSSHSEIGDGICEELITETISYTCSTACDLCGALCSCDGPIASCCGGCCDNCCSPCSCDGCDPDCGSGCC